MGGEGLGSVGEEGGILLKEEGRWCVTWGERKKGRKRENIVNTDIYTQSVIHWPYKIANVNKIANVFR